MDHAKDRHCLAGVFIQDDMVADRKFPIPPGDQSPQLRKLTKLFDCLVQIRLVGIGLILSPSIKCVLQDVVDITLEGPGEP